MQASPSETGDNTIDREQMIRSLLDDISPEKFRATLSPLPEPEISIHLATLTSALTKAVETGFQNGLQKASDTLDERRRNAGAELDAARLEGFMQAAEALMDARDRLSFSFDQARATLATFTGWRTLMGGREVLVTAMKGLELALSRLDDDLRNMRFDPLAKIGDAFNAESMRMVEESTSAHRAAGTVMYVLRQGYRRDGRIVRTADVRVAKGQE